MISCNLLLIRPQILAVYLLIYFKIEAKIKSFFQIHVGNPSQSLIPRRNGKTSGFGYFFWVFKIASREPSWVSMMDFCKHIVKYYWV